MPKQSSARPPQPLEAASGSLANGHDRPTMLLDPPAPQAEENADQSDAIEHVDQADPVDGVSRTRRRGLAAIASPRKKSENKSAALLAPATEGVGTEISATDAEVKVGRKNRSAARGESRALPVEAVVAALFVGATVAGSFALPRSVATAHEAERRAAEPIVIMPTVPLWATWEVKSRASVSFVSMQAPLRRGGVVVGEAPIAGQISRVRVREGQRVDSGDRILTVATSTTTTTPNFPPPRLPNTSRAERRQLQAVRRKEALEVRIAAARDEYDRAQARLDAANKRLNDARSLLSRIASGQAVPDPNASRASRRSRRVRRSNNGASSQAVEAAQDERRAALAASSSAEDAARAAQSKARSATYAVSSALSRERAARGEVDSARSKLKSVEAQFEAGTVKADALEEARAALSQAESSLSDAGKKAASAQSEVRGVQAEAVEARGRASAAAERAAQAVRNLKRQQARGRSTSEEEVSPEPEAPASGTLSVSAAARLVREAIAEAGTAAQEARRLKARVESYKGSATAISADIQSSARSIQQAQEQDLEQELDTTIATNLSSVRAPASGTVLSIASVGESVSPGDPIVRIARGPLGLEATMEDRTGAWKLLRPGMLLPGRLLSPEQAAAQAGGANQSTTTGRSPLVGGEPVTLKVREVEAPVGPNDAAEVRVGVVPGSGNASARRVVAIAVPRGKGALLSIPEGSVARGPGNQPIVGVLREVSRQAQVLAPASGGTVAAATPERMFEVEWRAVGLSDALPSTIPSAPSAPDEILAGNEKMKKVVSGLVPGERILRDASQWRARLASTASAAPGAPAGSVRVRLDVS